MANMLELISQGGMLGEEGSGRIDEYLKANPDALSGFWGIGNPLDAATAAAEPIMDAIDLGSGGGDPLDGMEEYFVDPSMHEGDAGGLLDYGAYAGTNVDFGGREQRAQWGDLRTEADRARASKSLDLLRAQAEGTAPSPAAIAAQRQQAAMDNALSAGAATGAYSPAAQRAAMYARTSGHADLGQRAAEAAARERLSAQQAYAAAAGQHYGMAGQLEANRGKLGQGYSAMGLQQMQDNRSAIGQGNQDRKGIHLGQLGARAGIAQSQAAAEANANAAKIAAIATVGSKFL